MSEKISRRSFLKGTAAGAVGAAAVGAAAFGIAGMGKNEPAASTQPEQPEEMPQAQAEPASHVFNKPDHWDYDCDVVVIGSGTASYAAIRAANEGLEVIVVEANISGGGATGFSGGGGWLPMNKWSVEAGDTKEKMMSYLKNTCRQTPITDAQIEAFIDNSQPMLDYYDPIFAKCSTPVQAMVSGLFGDYQAEWEGGVTNASHSVSYGGVTKWKNAYLEAITNCGGQIFYSTKALRYVWRYDENDVPEVLGLICQQNGQEVAIRARKAVVCGAGGYEWNDEMKNTFLSVETPYACSLSTCDGTMLKATMALAPKLMNMPDCWGQLCYKTRAAEQKANGAVVNIVFGRYFPHQIIVNQKGKRFADESTNYDSLWYQFGEYDTYAPYGKSNLPAFEIFDQTFVDEIKGFSVDYFLGDLVDGVPVGTIKADTLEELAEKTGIDKEGLIAEVKKWNQYCAEGEDKDFHRGEQYMDQMFNRMRDLTLPLEKNLGPIEGGPYYALEVAPNTLGTTGGPALNEHAQCLHISEQPIGRLYACGNFAGFGGPGRGYAGAGGTIGPALVMAYIAAGHIMETQKDWTGLELEVVAPTMDAQTEQEVVASDDVYNSGTYTATAHGIGGDFEVTVNVVAGRVTSIDVGNNKETAGLGDKAIERIIADVVARNSVEGVDALSGATVTSNALLEAIAECLAQAK